MKRSMYSILAALTLMVAAPVLAQQENLAGNEAQQEVENNRTNPDAASIAPGSALTITGTVKEWTDSSLTLKTDTGVYTIQIMPNTDWSQSLTEGETVSVDYTRTGQGVMIASLIRTEGSTEATTMDTEMESTVTETSTTSLNTDDEMDSDMDMDAEADLDTDTSWHDGSMDTEASASADLDTDTDVDVDVDTDAEMSTSLPSTGSELPLLGLLGLLSLAGAAGVKALR